MKVFECLDPLFLPHTGCNVRLELGPGQVLVLVGENGIGKSTLLQRFLSEVEIESVAFVEQKTSEYFYDRNLGVLKQMISGMDLPGFSPEDFLFLWEAFGLSEKEDRYTSNLSGGESQALKLCLALCKSAQFYFLDEPTQFLDAERKKVLLNYLDGLKLKGKSLMLVEHDRSWTLSGWQFQELKIESEQLTKGNAWTI